MSDPLRTRPDEEEDEGDVIVERLSGLDDWELYRFLPAGDIAPLFTVAVRPSPGTRQVEYGLWREGADKEDPGATGTVEQASGDGEWSDESREDVLRQVVYRYESDLDVPQESLIFHLSGPPEDLDDAPEDDDLDEEPEEDGEEADESDETDG
ncbi:MAG: hypothetical protein U0441_11525 [Polyangiaceae bacterium]